MVVFKYKISSMNKLNSIPKNMSPEINSMRFFSFILSINFSKYTESSPI